MYVRLAFAVAAHLRSEILIVDEVLAVGDGEFQKKCLGKMKEVSTDGRTVLFVSHNLGAVSRLCQRGLVLYRGNVAFYGTTALALRKYEEFNTECPTRSVVLTNWTKRFGSQEARIVSAELDWLPAAEHRGVGPSMGDTLRIRWRVILRQGIRWEGLRFCVVICNAADVQVLHLMDGKTVWTVSDDHEEAEVQTDLPELALYPGVYTVSLWCGSKAYSDFDYVRECLQFEVLAPTASEGNPLRVPGHAVFLHASDWLVTGVYSMKNPTITP